MDVKVKYRPSEPCSCDICRGYCLRPGWWTVEEAGRVIKTGLSYRMMAEISPERDFAVLAPAFRGNEGNWALQIFSKNGCTFLYDGGCELFGTGLQPLECRFCHHNRKGLGLACHLDIENDWKTEKGQRMVLLWLNMIGLNQKIRWNVTGKKIPRFPK